MKLKKQEIKEILKLYSIGNLKTKELIYNDWNTGYKIITTKDTFFLKVLNFQTEEILIKEINVLNKLKHKINCSTPILSNDKKYYIKYNNLIVYISNFIEGKSFSGKGGEKLSIKNLEKLGKIIAKIHSTKNLDDIPKKDLYEDLKKFFAKIDKESQEYEIAKSTFELLEKRKFDSLILSKGLIHADLHAGNLIYHDNKITAIIDFEDSHIGAFLYDLGITILDTCWDGKFLSDKRINALILGYEKVRKLTKKEKEHILNSIIIAGLYELQFKIRKNGINCEDNLNHYIIKRLMELIG